MEKRCFCSAALILLLFVVGCASMGEKATTGTVVGGIVGAAAGGIIGHQSGHGLEGAAIGGAVGAVSGGLVGNQMDKKALANNPNHITVIKVAEMAKQGVPDDVIISELQRTKSVYQLTSEVIAYLKDNKVGDKVINYMLTTK